MVCALRPIARCLVVSSNGVIFCSSPFTHTREKRPHTLCYVDRGYPTPTERALEQFSFSRKAISLVDDKLR